MTVQLVTGSNARYMPKMEPYLRTVEKHSRAENWLVCVAAEPPAYLNGKIRTVKQPLVSPVSPPETESLQHGSWLGIVPGEPNNVAIWTDGDIFMQRPFTDGEWADLENWPENAVGVSYNLGPFETLLDEAVFKLHPKASPGTFLDHWGTATLERICFNVGVMVARRATYQRIYDAYIKRWDEVGEWLAHPARQQWLIGWTIYELGLDIKILPYTFHTHAHFDLPEGTLVTPEGRAYYNNTPILFWHVPMWRRTA